MDIETVALLAKYNAHANREMGRIMAALSPEEWNREFQGYFKSVSALCSHIVWGDILWLHRFMQVKDFSFAKDGILAKDHPAGTAPFSSVEEYFEERLKLDDIFLSVSGELRQGDLSSMLSFTNMKGEKHTHKLGGLLLHCFNHQTHHRAMISLYLEFMGKPNDYSGLYQLT
jgi:uncharacterized damage-inducible protein DinB